MKKSKRTVIRSYKVNLPAQFARITLEELGIDSSVEKNTNRKLSTFQLKVGFDDAPLAHEILGQAELYENQFTAQGNKQMEKRPDVIKRLSSLFSYPN